MTASQYRSTEAGPPWFELIEGRLLQEPSPSTRHQSLQGNLYFALRGYLEGHPIAHVLAAPLDVYLDESNVFLPDLLVVLAERSSIIAAHGIIGAPDLVVEILSPANRRQDLGPKRKRYARAGVKRLWIADPEALSLRDYDLGDDPKSPVQIWERTRPQSLTCPLLPGFALEWSQLTAGRSARW